MSIKAEAVCTYANTPLMGVYDEEDNQYFVLVIDDRKIFFDIYNDTITLDVSGEQARLNGKITVHCHRVDCIGHDELYTVMGTLWRETLWSTLDLDRYVKSTKKEALDKAVVLWTEIAATGCNKHYAYTKLRLMPDKNECPCCTYAWANADGGHLCDKCPVVWAKPVTVGGEDVRCHARASPYSEWNSRRTAANAQVVLDLIVKHREALEGGDA